MPGRIDYTVISDQPRMCNSPSIKLLSQKALVLDVCNTGCVHDTYHSMLVWLTIQVNTISYFIFSAEPLSMHAVWI